MKKSQTILIVFALVINTNLSFGQHKTESFEIASKEVKGQTYSIEVILPDGYDSTKKHPILYFTDWWFASKLVLGLYEVLKYNIDPIIMVGIQNKSSITEEDWNRDRSRDLSPTNLPEKEKILQVPIGTTGGAIHFLSFIKNELIPTVENKYTSDIENRGFFGYSYGGLFGTYILVKEPDLFKKYLIGGATLWWDDYLILKEIEDLKSEHFASIKSIFLTVGENDGTVFLTDFSIIREQLLKKKTSSLKIETLIIQDENHITAIPSTILKGLKFLYGKN
jgi:predicted alpha/beta superfamily hydrolase